MALNIAIFASGNGSVARSIIYMFKKEKNINVNCIISDNPYANILNIAKNNNIPYKAFTKNEISEGNKIAQELKLRNTNFVVLAGFLKKIPSSVISLFPKKMVNTHPSLLPFYGGKGMYGIYVHQAVLRNKEKRTGFTVHYVNEEYDEGPIIDQIQCDIEPSDTPEKLQEKVKELEKKYYPEIIKRFICENEEFN